MSNFKTAPATPEQQNISDHFVASILFEEPETIVVEAPAGTGKSHLSTLIMKDLEKSSPKMKIGYFIFNSFMKEEIGKRAYVLDVMNTQFFTYHSFLLQHALKNEKLKAHFYDKEGNPLIDFVKQGYSKEEISKTVQFVLSGQNSEIMTDLLYVSFNEWLNSDKSLIDFSVETVKMLYGQTDIESLRDDEGYNPKEDYKPIMLSMDRVSSYLVNAEDAIVNRIGKQSGNVSPDSLAVLFLVQGMTHIMKTNKLSHSAYYKEVYNIALKENIDLFEDFDAIIVDEAQDMDRIFKQLIEISNKPLLVIGDRAQSIYAWRGAVNMMEQAGRKNTVYGLSYSFRYKNDIAQLSNLLLLQKKEPPAVLVSGSYTDKIRSIQDDSVSFSDMGQLIADTVEKRVLLCERIEGLSVNDMKQKELTKFLAKEKTAFICRNNNALIEALFKIMPIIRMSNQADNISISLTDSVSDEFLKIKKCDFGAKTNKKIERAVGVPYNEYKKGRSLEDMLRETSVRNAIFENNKINFLLDTDKLEHFIFLTDQLSLRKANSISKGDKNANLVFSTVHGAKGKEYKNVFLAWDILKPNMEGIITQEEYNIANVAVTRAMQNMYFVESPRGEPHHIREFYLENKERLEAILSKDFTYTFPYNVEMTISKKETKTGALYAHTFKNHQNGEISVFVMDEPITYGTVGYQLEKCTEGIKFWDINNRQRMISFDGDEKHINKKDNFTNYYYGVGKTKDSDILLCAKKKLSSPVDAEKDFSLPRPI